MWHEPHVMSQNKKWGGKIATSKVKFTTACSGGCQPRGAPRGWLATALAGLGLWRVANPHRKGRMSLSIRHSRSPCIARVSLEATPSALLQVPCVALTSTISFLEPCKSEFGTFRWLNAYSLLNCVTVAKFPCLYVMFLPIRLNLFVFGYESICLEAKEAWSLF
jgi:hypothetical protein